MARLQEGDRRDDERAANQPPGVATASEPPRPGRGSGRMAPKEIRGEADAEDDEGASGRVGGVGHPERVDWWARWWTESTLRGLTRRRCVFELFAGRYMCRGTRA